FQKGVIYSSSSTGTHGILGDPSNANTNWGKFANQDYDRGMGLPTSDVHQIGDLTWQDFQKGIIYSSAATGTQVFMSGHTGSFDLNLKDANLRFLTWYEANRDA